MATLFGAAEAARYQMRHEPGERGGRWVVADAGGQTRFSAARRPFGGTRIAVRDAGGEVRASVGERVLSLVEHYTLWRDGRPFARVFRPPTRGRPEHWLVEAGEGDAVLALVDTASGEVRLLRGGRQVAAVSGAAGAREVEVAEDEDPGMVLALAVLVETLEEGRH